MSVTGCNDCEKQSGLVVPGSSSGGSSDALDIVVQTDTTPPLTVTTTETPTKKTFTISYNPYVGFSAALSLDSIVCSPSLKSGNTPLRGVTVTDVTLSWAFTRDGGGSIDVDQAINGNVITPISTKSITYSSQVITTNQTYTLVGDDGTTQETDSENLRFGDAFYRGEVEALITSGSSDAAAIAVIDALAFSINTSGVGLYVDGTKSGGSWYTYFAVRADLTPVFDDVNDPSLADPMTLVKTVTYNNGAESISYNLYRSVNGALINSRIQIKSIS